MFTCKPTRIEWIKCHSYYFIAGWNLWYKTWRSVLESLMKSVFNWFNFNKALQFSFDIPYLCVFKLYSLYLGSACKSEMLLIRTDNNKFVQIIHLKDKMLTTYFQKLYGTIENRNVLHANETQLLSLERC